MGGSGGKKGGAIKGQREARAGTDEGTNIREGTGKFREEGGKKKGGADVGRNKRTVSNGRPRPEGKTPVPKRHAKERLGPRIKADTTSSPARNTTHEVVITCTTTGETPRIASMMESTEKMSNTMGERALGNRKLGLEMRHAPKSLKVIFQIS
jgi:hypothetical protein